MVKKIYSFSLSVISHFPTLGYKERCKILVKLLAIRPDTEAKTLQ